MNRLVQTVAFLLFAISSFVLSQPSSKGANLNQVQNSRTGVVPASIGVVVFDTIFASAGPHGTISPSGLIEVPLAADTTFTITPDVGYYIADVHVDTVSVGPVPSYTFTNVTANHVIQASFALQTFVVNAIADANGSISPSGPVSVNYGANQNFTITPNTGYYIADVHVDSVSVGPVPSYTFTNVTATHVIEASFALQTFTVNAIANANGSISPSGAVTVNYGADQGFTITPDIGYFIADVHVDSVSVGAVSNYTFTHVTANHVIEASFAFQAFTISASAGPHGTISPSGAVPAASGGSRLFTITPDSAYFIADVHVDSVSVGAVSQYTFTNIQSDHTIQAFFDTHPVPQLTSVSPDSARRGQTVSLVLVGANFINGVSTLNVGAGITVNSLTVHTTDSLLASITVGAGATLGSRTFTVTNSPPGGGTSGPVTFRVLNVTGVVERGKGVPSEYALHQNYPNPFNPSTAIEFDLPHQSVVTLVVYNLLGQEIATLIDHRTMEIGYQVARFDASQLPSGVYLYRILADGADGKSFVQVRKMMLMR